MERFTDNGDGTVTDNLTGLMWQQEDDGKQRTWQESVDYANGLELGGHTNWRLPALREFGDIIEYTRHTPAIDTAVFPNTKSSDYWSSTTFADNPSLAWSVPFDNGYVYDYYKTYYYYVRCVRTVGEGK